MEESISAVILIVIHKRTKEPTTYFRDLTKIPQKPVNSQTAMKVHMRPIHLIIQFVNIRSKIAGTSQLAEHVRIHLRSIYKFTKIKTNRN